MIFTRVYSRVHANTFDCPEIGKWVNKFLKTSRISVDPFARNTQLATYTNDINSKTNATYHMDARAFLKMLALSKIQADLIIIDPPYSPTQIKREYAEAELKVTMVDTQNAKLYSEVKAAVKLIAAPNAKVISFGWNSSGMGRPWMPVEIMLVCHGSAHNDTICMAEENTLCAKTQSNH